MSGQRHRILIVDDDADLRALLGATLRDKYEVVEAVDGLDALNRLADLQPDLAIIDYEMPLMSGLELCASIRKHPEFNGIPVLFLSGHGSKDNLKRGYAAGADLFLVKPIEPSRVLKNIDLTIEQDSPPVRPKRHSIDQLQSGGAESESIPLGDPVASGRTARTKPAPPPTPTHTPSAPRPGAGSKDAGTKSSPRFSINKASPDTGRARVMVVDNEEDARQLMELTLRDNFEVTTAHDGLDAIEKLVAYQPDLLLIDVMMPRMNGFHLLQSIRRNPSYSHLPVIIVTGRAGQRDKDYAEKMGANDFVAKPFSTDDLLERVRKIAAAPGFIIAPKNISIEEIIEREYLAGKDKQDQKSRDEMKRKYAEIQDVIDEEARRQKKK